MRALVVVPTYNESATIRAVIEQALAAAPACDVLVVDDNSPDGTADLVAGMADRRVHLLRRLGKAGLGRAYRAGFAWALARDYALICEMDGDHSHDPADLPRLLDAAGQADLVLGSRYLGGIRVLNWPRRRLLLSRSAARYVRWITGMPFSDPTSGYKCFRRAALERIDLSGVRSNGYSFQIELTHRIWSRGGRVIEVPIVFSERPEGTSKMSGRIVLEAIWVVLRLSAAGGARRRPAAPA